jgi:putative membrane protein
VKKTLWVLIAFYVIQSVATASLPQIGQLGQLAPFTSVTILTAFAAVHGVHRYGWRRFLIFFVLTFAISWSYETSSILTGFPFGHYYYTERLGPKLGLVPVLIMPAYFSVGYLSWTIAHILLDRFDDRLTRSELVLVPVFASFVMVMWDLCMDPARSTIGAAWIWRDGGGYFGVPLVNFLGWYLCVFTIYLAFAFYVRRSVGLTRSMDLGERTTWTLPVIMYGALIVGGLIQPLVADSFQVTSSDNHVWWTGDLYTYLALVSLFTMLFVALLALVRVRQSAVLR